MHLAVAPPPVVTPAILLIDAPGDDELSPIARRLDVAARQHGITLRQSQDIPHPARWSGEPPALVVCLQRWPEEYAAASVTRLLSEWPLTQFLCIYGPWCISDGRTRQSWPLPLRLPAAEAESKLNTLLSDWPPAQPAIPLTASRTEHFAIDYSIEPTGTSLRVWETASHDVPEGIQRPARILIDSADRDYTEALADLVRSWGGQPLLPAVAFPDGAPDLVLRDADLPRAPLSFETVAHPCLARSYGHIPSVVALCGFPRRDDMIRLANSGCRQVLAKTSSADALRQSILAALKDTRPESEQSCAFSDGVRNCC